MTLKVSDVDFEVVCDAMEAAKVKHEASFVARPRPFLLFGLERLANQTVNLA